MKKLLIFLTVTGSLFAGLSVGQPFPKTPFQDQFEKRHTVPDEERIVIVSFEREVSDAVNAFLGKQPKDFLAKHRATYIADISAMPTIISTLFALPKMRDYRYPILLNRDEAFKKKYDNKEGKLTIYRLEDGKIVSVNFIDTETLPAFFAE